MKTDNIVQIKSYRFAIRIVNLSRHLIEIKKECVLSKQILKSGTSIGANIEEAIGGQSKKDFLSKISVAYKEARESDYWLRLLRDTHFITDDEANSLLADLEELIKIIGKIQTTTKMKMTNGD
ncbi:MAG: four helix bundle protein [Ignavibacteriales bacterium]|nr:four helix bundle protein [Ignavibacteriales bacterium]